MAENSTVRTSGTYQITMLNAYLDWYRNLSGDETTKIANQMQEDWSNIWNSRDISSQSLDVIRAFGQSNSIDKFFSCASSYYMRDWTPKERDAWWRDIAEENTKKYERFFHAAEEHQLKIQVVVATPSFAALSLGNKTKGVVLAYPDRYGVFIPDDISDELSPAQLRMALKSQGIESGPQSLPAIADASATPNQLKATTAACVDEIDSLQKKLDSVQDESAEELQDLKQKMLLLQQQMEARKQVLEQQLQEKMQELNEKKKKMERQIYLLRSEIYSIQCYMGTAVPFTHIRKGANAPDASPVVIHQKLRFLDEDLAKLASLYEIQWEDIEEFEKLLQYNDQAMEEFAPNERCVTLVRLSRTGTLTGYSYDYFGRRILDTFDYEHGSTVGILIRNGENLYLGWTDEDHVEIQDDLIFSQGSFSAEVVPASASEDSMLSREQLAKRQEDMQNMMMHAVISRHFIYNILQGIVDNSNLLPLPAGTVLSEQSDLVKYAVADAWLEDTRFGSSFDDILKQTQGNHKKGDMILTTQHISPIEYGFSNRAYGYRTWENCRGRGAANRTHDCSVANCELYPINLIEENGGRSQKPSYSYYVSVKKTEQNWRREEEYVREPRANFEVFPEEFLNLTFLDSVQLCWTLENKKLGAWRIDGKVIDYAYAVKYIKTALDYVRKREEEERRLITEVNDCICANPDWPVWLTEWKLEKDVRTITSYQAKRFARWAAEKKLKL